MRVAILAPGRAPITVPFTSAIEANAYALTMGLRERGIDVELFAAEGSAPELQARPLSSSTFGEDVAPPLIAASTAEGIVADTFGYLEALREIRDEGGFDLIHNLSLNYLPVALARMLDVPLITTLQTPADPFIAAALEFCPGTPTIAVSNAVAELWRPVTSASVIRPALDLTNWRVGEGGGPLVWMGPIAPSHAPHAAARIAHASGRELRIVGPILDRDYFKQKVLPLLDKPVAYLGHLEPDELGRLLGASSACLVTPTWDEPSGYGALMAMACGTPVVAIARGALPELITDEVGRLLDIEDDDAAAADAIEAAVLLDRRVVRARAEEVGDRAVMLDQTILFYEAHAAKCLG